MSKQEWLELKKESLPAQLVLDMVSSEYGRRGVGKLLMDTVLEDVCQVYEVVERSTGFWEIVGYKKEKEKKVVF